MYGFNSANEALTKATNPETGQRIDLHSAKALSRRLGITYKELLAGIAALQDLNQIVAADVVELSPQYDPSGASTAVACKTVREMLLTLTK